MKWLLTARSAYGFNTIDHQAFPTYRDALRAFIDWRDDMMYPVRGSTLERATLTAPNGTEYRISYNGRVWDGDRAVTELSA